MTLKPFLDPALTIARYYECIQLRRKQKKPLTRGGKMNEARSLTDPAATTILVIWSPGILRPAQDYGEPQGPARVSQRTNASTHHLSVLLGQPLHAGTSRRAASGLARDHGPQTPIGCRRRCCQSFVASRCLPPLQSDAPYSELLQSQFQTLDPPAARLRLARDFQRAASAPTSPTMPMTRSQSTINSSLLLRSSRRQR